VGIAGVDQPAVWFATGADGCMGGPIYAESSPVAMLIESSSNVLGPIHSHTGFSKNIVIKGERNTLGPIDVEVAPNATGVMLQGPFHKLLGGSIQIDEASSAVGVQIAPGTNSGKGLVIRDIRFFGASSTQGTAFITAAKLNSCTIRAHFQNVGTAMNLYPNSTSMIGENNIIDITVDELSVTVDDIVLPPTWDDVSNQIIVNGVPKDGSP
jgi:hypothetical protein